MNCSWTDQQRQGGAAVTRRLVVRTHEALSLLRPTAFAPGSPVLTSASCHPLAWKLSTPQECMNRAKPLAKNK